MAALTDGIESYIIPKLYVDLFHRKWLISSIMG